MGTVTRIASISILLVLLSGGSWAEDRLLYAVTYKGLDKVIGGTEVFVVDPETAQAEKLFSDAGAEIIVNGSTTEANLGLAAGGRLFAEACLRTSQGRRRYHTAALYELATDGSNSSRRITPVSLEVPFRNFFVNPDGTRAGFLKHVEAGRQHLFIHDTATGELVREIDLNETFLDCFASSIAWLPDGNRIFFSLETGCADATSSASYDQVGNYIMDESGHNVTRLGDLPTREGHRPPEAVRLIGMRPSGEFVIAAAEQRLSDPKDLKRSLFIVTGLETGDTKTTDVSFGPDAALPIGIAAEMALSHSGRYVAANDILPSRGDSFRHIWLKDLESGLEKKLVSLPTNGMDGPYLQILGWIDSD